MCAHRGIEVVKEVPANRGSATAGEKVAEDAEGRKAEASAAPQSLHKVRAGVAIEALTVCCGQARDTCALCMQTVLTARSPPSATTLRRSCATSR